MKKNRFLVAVMLFAAVGITTFVSCKKDKSEEPQDPATEQNKENEDENTTPSQPTPVTYTLTVLSSDEEMGTINGGGTYKKGAKAALSATPANNHFLSAWSDCDSKELIRIITITSDTSVTAFFAKKIYLTVLSENDTYGSATGSGYYMPNAQATLTATPNIGYRFVKWDDDNTENPRIITVTDDATYTAVFAVRPSSGIEANHEWVDLGLPSCLKWATCNIGATKPEEAGNFYAWGETETKSSYSWATYKWCNGSENTLTKYCNNAANGQDGFTDNKTTLEPEDDAAHVNWGGVWRMPTEGEYQELRDNCTWTWVENLNGSGVNGYEVKGINGMSIFFPVAGCRTSSSSFIVNAECGYHWTSSLSHNSLCCTKTSIEISSYLRYSGRTIRGVCE